jgi:Domain of unknown function (DUF222)
MPMLSSQRSLPINHDGLLAGLRGTSASGDLFQHNGLPATIVVSTTLADLEAARRGAAHRWGQRIVLCSKDRG